MQDAQNLAEFMYLSYSQSLWETGIKVLEFKELTSKKQKAWLSSAETAIEFITTNINTRKE